MGYFSRKLVNILTYFNTINSFVKIRSDTPGGGGLFPGFCCGALTFDVTNASGGVVGDVKHVGVFTETVTEVTLSADGTYRLAIDHAGPGKGTVTITQ